MFVVQKGMLIIIGLEYDKGESTIMELVKGIMGHSRTVNSKEEGLLRGLKRLCKVKYTV